MAADVFMGESIPIPKQIFNDDYPTNPKTFGERLRKARMDAGLQIRKFAEIIGATGVTVINWDLRGMNRRRWRIIPTLS
jgi:DNA-binding transcriptional regulator YiaG